MEAAAKNSEKKIRAAGKIWRDDETRKLLEPMKGGEEGLGFYGRMKVKKLERNRAMSAIAANLSADNIAVTSQQVNNKWKSLLARYRVVEDHNRQSGVPESVPVMLPHTTLRESSCKYRAHVRATQGVVCYDGIIRLPDATLAVSISLIRQKSM